VRRAENAVPPVAAEAVAGVDMIEREALSLQGVGHSEPHRTRTDHQQPITQGLGHWILSSVKGLEDIPYYPRLEITRNRMKLFPAQA
jgi:hypothetical protein